MAKIYISPGHGGNFPGTSGHGFVEKDLNLEIAMLVRDELQSYDCVVRLARGGDHTKLISDRALEANNWSANLLVDLHFNGYNNSQARGFETFIHDSLFDHSNTSKIRNVIHDTVYSIFQGKTPDRGKKKADFQILRETKMSAVLIEYLFITSLEDADLISSLKVAMAKATADGIAKGLNLSQKAVCPECKKLKKDLEKAQKNLAAAHKKINDLQMLNAQMKNAGKEALNKLQIFNV